MDVLIIDDWGLAVLNAMERRNLLEILEDRHGRASTIVTSQLPVEHWHEAIETCPARFRLKCLRLGVVAQL